MAFSEYPNFKLAIAGMCVIAGVLPEKSTDPAAKKNVTIHTKENVRLKKKIRVKSSACLTVLTIGGIKLACKDPSFEQSLVIFEN